MIELIKELPDNVVGILVRGRVTNEECDGVLRPAMEASLRRHGKIRLYYEVGSRFPGAGWDDLDLAVDHLPQWERIAIVTDTGWVRQTVNALRFLIASEIRVFTRLEIDEGRAWIAASDAEAPGAAPPVRLPRAHAGLRARLRHPPVRASRRGDRRYRRPSAGDRQVPLT